MQAIHRITPLVLVGVIGDALAERCVRDWADTGAVIVRAHDAQGCLRVATSAGPDVIVLDPRFSSRVVALLKAHPISRSARLVTAPAQAES
jgi:xanthine/CO dehydrogenase XdhC/CoxF family maturation factor